MNKFILFVFAFAWIGGTSLWAQPADNHGQGDQDQKNSPGDNKKPKDEKNTPKQVIHPAPGKPNPSLSAPQKVSPHRPADNPQRPSGGPGFSQPVKPKVMKPNQDQQGGLSSHPGTTISPKTGFPRDSGKRTPNVFSPGGNQPGFPGMKKKEGTPAEKAPVQRGPLKKAPPVISERYKRLGISRLPDPVKDRSKWPDSRKDRSVVLNPSRDYQGKPFHLKDLPRTQIGRTEVKRHMKDIATNPQFVREMDHIRTADKNVNFYYWHSWNNNRYCHYIDHWGAHWYGWTVGPSFYWTRYNAGYWWWYDPDFGRWCYWHDGWWWWHDPYHVNVAYVYVDGNYVSSNPGTEEPPAVEPSNLRTYKSSDGTRLVKVLGQEEDAFLYDASTPPDFDPVYLASGVQEVKFSSTNSGRRLQVLVFMRDGSFSLFDDRGNPDSGTAEEASPGF